MKFTHYTLLFSIFLSLGFHSSLAYESKSISLLPFSTGSECEVNVNWNKIGSIYSQLDNSKFDIEYFLNSNDIFYEQVISEKQKNTIELLLSEIEILYNNTLELDNNIYKICNKEELENKINTITKKTKVISEKASKISKEINDKVRLQDNEKNKIATIKKFKLIKEDAIAFQEVISVTESKNKLNRVVKVIDIIIKKIENIDPKNTEDIWNYDDYMYRLKDLILEITINN